MFKFGHTTTTWINNLCLYPVPGEYSERRFPNARVIVIDKTGGVEHRLTAKRRRLSVNFGSGVSASGHKGLTMKFGQSCTLIDPSHCLHHGPCKPVFYISPPISKWRHRCRHLAIAVSLRYLLLNKGYFAGSGFCCPIT